MEVKEGAEVEDIFRFSWRMMLWARSTQLAQM
jgi:hypothetical protein